jgi:hypothetical protein
MRKLATVFLLITSILTACTASGAPASPLPPASVTVNLVTNPDPAKVGDVELRFTVTDAKGQPVTGADFDVFADHTDMSGMTMHGKATEQGNGQYSITANFSMAGSWKLSIAVKKDGLDHKQDIELKVR